MRNSKLDELNLHVQELKTKRKKIIDVIHEKKFLQSISYEFTLNNGIVIPREKLLKGGNDGSAVIILPYVKDSNEILVTIEPRVFTDRGVSVGFPAGYIEKGELATVAAERELKEETGYVPKRIEHVDSFYQDEGVSSAFNHILFAYECEKVFNQDLDPFEVVRYMTFTLDELNELERIGYINSSNTKLTLSRANWRKNEI